MNADVVFIVDDDQAVRDGLAMLLEAAGLTVQCYDSAEAFLQEHDPRQWGCLVLDVRMPGLSGPQLQQELARRGWLLPVIFLTAHGDIPTSVRTVKAGAVDFLTKPVAGADLLERVRGALRSQQARPDRRLEEATRRRYLEQLTPREIEVLKLVAAGHSNKVIGRQLQISFRTVELHRSHMLQKTGAASMFELARLFMTAAPPATAAPAYDPSQRRRR